MNRLKYVLLMASLVLAMAFMVCCSSDDEGKGDSGGSDYSDKGRDIANYKTVPIGTQIWMAENHDYAVSGSKCYGEGGFVYNPKTEEWDLELTASQIQDNCTKYGRLYNWYMAMTICPSGWHLPSNEEWDILIDYVQTDNGGTYTSGDTAFMAAKYLKAKSGWNDYEGQNGNGEDKYGFAALPSGSGNTFDEFGGYGFAGGWWSASEDSKNTWNIFGNIAISYPYGKNELFGVRCVKD